MNTTQALITQIATLCRSAGNTSFSIKGNNNPPTIIWVCLGRRWMDEADGSNNQYDQLVDKLLEIKHPTIQIDVCGDVHGGGVVKLY